MKKLIILAALALTGCEKAIIEDIKYSDPFPAVQMCEVARIPIPRFSQDCDKSGCHPYTYIDYQVIYGNQNITVRNRTEFWHGEKHPYRHEQSVHRETLSVDGSCR